MRGKILRRKRSLWYDTYKSQREEEWIQKEYERRRQKEDEGEGKKEDEGDGKGEGEVEK